MPCQCTTDKQRAKCTWWISGDGLPPEVNIATGEVRATRGCFPEVALRWLVDVSRTNHSAAAAVESTRNIIAEGFVHVAPVIAQAILAHPQPLLLENPGNGSAERE